VSVRSEHDEALDILADVLYQACSDSEGLLDSMALSAYADGMRHLARYGRLHVTAEYGRRVIGRLTG
jgi:hypothetical protein